MHTKVNTVSEEDIEREREREEWVSPPLKVFVQIGLLESREQKGTFCTNFLFFLLLLA